MSFKRDFLVGNWISILNFCLTSWRWFSVLIILFYCHFIIRIALYSTMNTNLYYDNGTTSKLHQFPQTCIVLSNDIFNPASVYTPCNRYISFDFHSTALFLCPLFKYFIHTFTPIRSEELNWCILFCFAKGSNTTAFPCFTITCVQFYFIFRWKIKQIDKTSKQYRLYDIFMKIYATSNICWLNLR